MDNWLEGVSPQSLFFASSVPPGIPFVWNEWDGPYIKTETGDFIEFGTGKTIQLAPLTQVVVLPNYSLVSTDNLWKISGKLLPKNNS